jgi:glycosyltransferase involved in cell wall biosynthesis
MAIALPHICHLTVLNPALHSRIFHKQAMSMVEAGFKVSVVGQDASPQPYHVEGVQVLPLPVFHPRSVQRFRVRKQIWDHAVAVNADVYVVHAPELLGMASKLKKRFPQARFVYDMHEDYALNIREAGYYPFWLKGILANRVRQAELAFASWGDAVVFAETCFETLLDMKSGVGFTLPNLFRESKTAMPELPTLEDGLPILLFSGTVAENWGIRLAVETWKQLNAKIPVRLVVAGIAYDKALKNSILEQVAQSGFSSRFLWWGNGEYVPHTEILAWIKASQLGLTPYILRPNLAERMPTRFFEFMAMGKPVLFTQNPPWDELNARVEFGLSTNWPVVESTLDEIALRLESGWSTRVPAHIWSWEAQTELPRYLSWLKG